MLKAGPADSGTIARDWLGLDGATAVVADRVALALLGADPRVSRLRDGRWALANAAWSSPKLANCVFAVVDVETTGTSPRRGDRIVEIAVVTATTTTLELEFESLVNPERSVGAFTSALTQITDDMVRDQPTFGEIADDVMGVLAGRVFVAHNARFDWGFLAREMRLAKDLTLGGPRLCTLDLARRLIPGLKSRNLDSVAAYFGVEIDSRHRAAGDALATARVLQRLIDLARDRGAVTLEDLDRRGAPPARKRTALPHSVKET